MVAPERPGEERGRQGALDPAPFVINAFRDVIESLTDEIRKVSEEFGPAGGVGARLPRESTGPLDAPVAETRAARPFPGPVEPLLEFPERFPPPEMPPVAPLPREPESTEPAADEEPARDRPGAGAEEAPPPAPAQVPRDVLLSPDDLEASVPDDLFGPPGTAASLEEGLLAPLTEEERRTAEELIEASRAAAAPLAESPPVALAEPVPAKPVPAEPVPGAPGPPSSVPGAPQEVRTAPSGTDVDAEMAHVESLIQGQLKQLEKVKGAEPETSVAGAKVEAPVEVPAPRASAWNPFAWLDRKAVAFGLGPLKPFLGYAGLGFLATAVITALSFWMYWKS